MGRFFVILFFMVMIACCIVWIIVYQNLLKQDLPRHHRQEKMERHLPIYCINLDTALNRKEHIYRKFVIDMGLSVNFVSAVDTREGKWRHYNRYLTDKAMEQLERSIEDNVRQHHHELTPGAVGCFLSHIRCFERFLARNPQDDDYALILEDDSNPLPEFKEALISVLNQPPPDADIILMSFIAFGNTQDIQVSDMEYVFLDYPSRFYLLNAYLVSGKGARNIMQHFEESHSRFEKQIDSHMTELVNNQRIKVYTLTKDMCPQTALGPTSIQTVPMREK